MSIANLPDQNNPAIAQSAARVEFLQKMYVQLWDDAKLHTQQVWQIAVSVGSLLFIFKLTADRQIAIEQAYLFVAIVLWWFLSHVIVANHCYRRNFAIIANIERQFLRVAGNESGQSADAIEIHNYFVEHYPRCHLISHFRIQYIAGLSLGVLLLALYMLSWAGCLPFSPSVEAPSSGIAVIPVFAFAFAYCQLNCLRMQKEQQYADFIRECPGREFRCRLPTDGG